jgi:hypothetical protein
MEQAAWERREFGDGRKSLVASLYTERYLGQPGALRGIDAPAAPALEHYDALLGGTLTDERPR